MSAFLKLVSRKSSADEEDKSAKNGDAMASEATVLDKVKSNDSDGKKMSVFARMFSGNSSGKQTEQGSDSLEGETGDSPTNASHTDDTTNTVDRIKSSDSDGKKLTVFARVFSGSGKRTEQENNSMLEKKESADREQVRASLVPPNFKPIFRKREIPETRIWKSTEWVEDLISGPDNGIKRELRDMFSIFDNMEKMPLMLTMTEISVFVDWFRTFSHVLMDLFDLEETCLFEWIQGTDTMSSEEKKWESPPGKISGELSEGRRMRMKGRIVQLASDVEEVCSRFEGRPILQGLPILAKAVDVFVDDLLQYLDLKIDVLPETVYGRLKQKDRLRFEKKYWSEAQHAGNSHITIAVAISWMDKGQRRKWKTKHLSGSAKGEYAASELELHSTHHAKVISFAERVHESEAERANQMALNEMARARAQELPGPIFLDTSDSEGPSVGAIGKLAGNGYANNMASPRNLAELEI